MSDNVTHAVTRREMLAAAGTAAAAGTLAGVSSPAVHAAGDDLVRVALVGCGGRGTGAAIQALSTKTPDGKEKEMGPTALYAMADVFTNRMDDSFKTLSNSK